MIKNKHLSELDWLKQRVLFMGTRVEELLDSSVAAFLKRNARQAAALVPQDREIDALESEIDDFCLKLFARRQPVARDLRFVTTVFKLVTHLERAGDLGETICKRTLELSEQPAVPVPESLLLMCEMAPSLLADSLTAFSSADVERALGVVSRDHQLDTLYTSALTEAARLTAQNPEAAGRYSLLTGVAKALERIGDQATNVGELVVFMVEGRRLTHTRDEEGSGSFPRAALLPSRK